MELLAKRAEKNGKVFFQTLRGHTEDALWYLRREFDDLRWYESFCQRWNIPVEDFLRACFMSVAFHDIGKSIRQFQKNIQAGRKSSPYPHPFYAVAVVHNLTERGGYKPLIPEWTSPELAYPLLEVLAILAHHTQLHRDIYRAVDRRIDWEKQAAEFPTYVGDWFQRLGYKKFFDWNVNFEIDLKYVQRYDARKILKFIHADFCFEDVQRIKRGLEANVFRLKAIYSTLLALLKRCDINASRRFDENARGGRIKVEFSESIGDLTDIVHPKWLSLREQLAETNTPYPYQRAVEVAPDYVMLLAPCGRGKTEAAISWATRLARERRVKRIILAMPTQVTSTAMWKRVGEQFGFEHVGLYHGRSFGELQEFFSDNDQSLDVNEVQTEQFKGETLWKSITVTTVDHLLYAFIHGYPQADFSLGHLLQSAIIFDEVHYYDRQMLGNLKQLFSILRNWRVPHLLMSGTFPSFLRNEVDPEHICYQWHEDKQGLQYAPFVIERRSVPMIARGEQNDTGYVVDTKVLELIEEAFSRGRKVAVILNTVPKAKAAYRQLKQRNLIQHDQLALLHSQFTFADRRKKEAEVLQRLKEEKPFVVVSTQVIEVSLDFSSDLMLTEVSPADALGQRAGRLNRGKQEPQRDGWQFRLVVFPIGENVAPYLDAKLAVQRTWNSLAEGPTSYQDIRQLCEGAYEGWELKVTNMSDLFQRNTLFGDQPREIRFSEDEGRIFKTRQDSEYTIDVIPDTMYMKIGFDSLTAEYLVSVPFWWYKKSAGEDLGWFQLMKDERDRSWILCRIPYDNDLGFDDTVVFRMVGVSGIFVES